ncbi:MAG: hypothetical protein ACOVQI_00815, partial [Tagaea sp.]
MRRTSALVEVRRSYSEFLTGQALTIVLDLVFCLVFVAIMVWYAPLLALVVVGAFPLYVLVSVVV